MKVKEECDVPKECKTRPIIIMFYYLEGSPGGFEDEDTHHERGLRGVVAGEEGL